MNMHSSQQSTLAVIGGGQAAKVLLSKIAEASAQGDERWRGTSILVFERGSEFGTGLAWSRRNVLPEHMTSLSSSETRGEFGDRQLQQVPGLVRLLAEFGVTVHLVKQTEIVDIRPAKRSWLLHAASGTSFLAQAAVLATGHWTNCTGESPWPATTLQAKHAASDGRVLICGTGLSAIDSAITLSLGAGRFVQGVGRQLDYLAESPLDITMASSSGCLPAVWGATPPILSDLQHELKEKLSNSQQQYGVLPLGHALDHLVDMATEYDVETAGTGFAPGLSLTDRLDEIERREQARARYPWRTLRHDLRLVLGQQWEAAGAELRQIPLQNFLLATIPIISEAFHHLSAEDRSLFKSAVRGPLYRHAMPMVLESALFIDALFRAGVLRVVQRCVAPSSEDARLVVNAMGQEEDLTKNDHPLWRSLHAQGFIGGVIGPGDVGSQPSVDVDPSSRRLRSVENPLYAMGPVTLETFADAQSIGHLMRDAEAIVGALANAQSGFQAHSKATLI